MGRWLRFAVALVVTVAVAAGVSKVPEALARVEAFQVRDVKVEGHQFLTREEAIRTAAVPEGASVWDDMEPLEFRLRSHPLLRDASVRRKLPSTLVMRVVEREPVALLPTPILEPVDATGQILPLDPATHRLDLPVLHPMRRGSRDAPVLTPGQVRTLAEAAARIGAEDPQFLGLISELGMDARGGIIATLMEPAVEVFFRTPLSARRIQEGLLALADAMEREPDRSVKAVDLRFTDQVVVRYSNTRRR